MGKEWTIYLHIFLSLAILLADYDYAFGQEGVYICKNGQVSFLSDAPLELIKAKSEVLQGVIDPSTSKFAFSILINSFDGFNSSLQKEHFNENYLKSEEFPRSTFQGKIIEDVDFTQDGEYMLRAKGQLAIHGMEQERIIKCTLRKKEDSIVVYSEFTIYLKDHNISIPKIVNQKIAEEIQVIVKAEFSYR